MNKTIFMTGVTGALGKDYIVKQLTTSEDDYVLLVRGSKGVSGLERVRLILEDAGLDGLLGTRVKVHEGDITKDQLGLTDADFHGLAHEVDEIHHIAALTQLNGSKKNCFKINHKGTLHVLEMAHLAHSKGKLSKLIYFSTAYSVGSLKVFHASEDSLPVEPAHANAYEESKYAAETEVRKAMAEGLPVIIFKPSIVVGDSKTGKVAEFNVIYPFVKLFVHGIIRKIPTRLENAFNIVPIDFVIDASVAIGRQSDAIGKAFHLVTQNPPTMGSILDLKEEVFPQMPEIEVVDPETFKPNPLDIQQQFIYGVIKPYMGYLNGGLTFETKNTEEYLEGTGVTFPNTDSQFFVRLLQYAIDVGYLVV